MKSNFLTFSSGKETFSKIFKNKILFLYYTGRAREMAIEKSFRNCPARQKLRAAEGCIKYFPRFLPR